MTGVIDRPDRRRAPRPASGPAGAQNNAHPHRMTATIGASLERVLSMLSASAAAVSTMTRRLQNQRLLSSLDDRALQDIGLNRTMILGVCLHGTCGFKDAAAPTCATL